MVMNVFSFGNFISLRVSSDLGFIYASFSNILMSGVTELAETPENQKANNI